MDATPGRPCPKITVDQECLTLEQEIHAQHFAQARIAVMLAPAPSDDAAAEAQAEEHLRAAYRVAGLEPVPVRWFDSPLSFVRQAPEASVKNHMMYRVRQMTRLIGSVPASVWDVLPENMSDGVWDGVWDGVGSHVRTALLNSLGVRALEYLPHAVWSSISNSVESYASAHSLSFYRFLHEMFEPNESIHVARFNELVCGYLLGSAEAWVVRKPILLKRDVLGRLHSETGMCAQWRDGWGFYAWHGVRCAERVILHPETLTRQDWMKENNLEVRRVIQERMGPKRFVELIGGKCINRGQRGDLIEVDLPDDPEKIACYVHVQDTSTSRMYYLRVPPTIKSADEGVAWTFGLTRATYHPAQET